MGGGEGKGDTTQHVRGSSLPRPHFRSTASLPELQLQGGSSMAKVTGTRMLALTADFYDPGPQAFQAAEGGSTAAHAEPLSPVAGSRGRFLWFLRLPFCSSCPVSLSGCGHARQPLREPRPRRPCSSGRGPCQGISEQEAESTRGRGPGRKYGSSVLSEQETGTVGFPPAPSHSSNPGVLEGKLAFSGITTQGTDFSFGTFDFSLPTACSEGALGIRPGCLSEDRGRTERHWWQEKPGGVPTLPF